MTKEIVNVFNLHHIDYVDKFIILIMEHIDKSITVVRV